MNRAVLALMACVAIRMATPVLAAAQTDFAALRLKPGKIVRVTEEDGTRTKGLLTNLTPDTIGVGDRTFSATRVARIEREGDALWNGIAIGAALGLVPPLLASKECFPQSRTACFLTSAESGALLGLVVDALHRGYTTVYRSNTGRAARVAPLLGGRTRGVAVSMMF